MRFADALIEWQRRAGRHALPWQSGHDAYRVWVSEIMLQQTQVATVLGYYERFLARFPDVRALAAASLDEVLGLWSGLGYYSRARNLHHCAREVVVHHGGVLPTDAATLETLPGIGRSTAAAIAVFAAGERAPILDGNVKRVLARVFAVDGYPGEAAVQRRLWAIAERELPAGGADALRSYTQGLMDLGATVCVRTRPRCDRCPVAARCEARLQDRIASLPAPRPVRLQPVRSAELVLAVAGDTVLLERRPTAGLWGGLWSLPEYGPPREVDAADAAHEVDPVAIAAWLSARVGRPLGAARPFASIRHAFTHFRLAARVWRIDLPGGRAADVAGHEWLVLSEMREAPLPRPVRSLLQDLNPPGLREA